VVSLFVALRDEQRLALLVVTHNAAVAQQLGRCRVLKDGTLHE
jgi:ABC-type lipoprotein export system ATPase subunit